MSALPDPLASRFYTTPKRSSRLTDRALLTQYFQLGTDPDAVLADELMTISPHISFGLAANELGPPDVRHGEPSQTIQQGVASIWPSQTDFLEPSVIFAFPTIDQPLSEASEIRWLRE